MTLPAVGRVVLVAGTAALLVVRAGAGQLPEALSAARATGLPGWMDGWSALRPAGDHGRSLPGSVALPDLLRAPTPRVGPFWTAGNPAGLALEAGAPWGELRLAGAGETGAFRRPLDQDGTRVIQLSGLRWQALGTRGAVVGRVVGDVTEADLGSFSPVVVRHSSDPFVATDTTNPPMRHVRVALEGGYAWRRAGWAAGFLAGAEVSDDRTRRARLPRLGRSATPGLSAGLARELAGGRLVVSGYGRWTGGSELARVVALPGVEGVVHRLQGYSDPEPEIFSGRIVSALVERDARSAGLALSGELGGARWVSFAERTERTHEHRRETREDAPRNRWVADGWRLGAAASRPVGLPGLQAVGSVEATRLHGDAYRADLEGSIFRAREEGLRIALDLRYEPGGAWGAGMRAELERDVRERRDFIARVGSDIAHWAPSLALEVVRELAPGTRVSLAGALAVESPDARLPDPDALGPVYRQLVGPELSLYAVRTEPTAVGAAVRRDVAEGVALHLGARWERVAGPRQPEFPLTPEGTRTRWRAGLTALWRR